jgi:hypothetical protein
MGEDVAAGAPIMAGALDLAERLATAAGAGRVDLADLGRRARRLLALTTIPPEDAGWAQRGVRPPSDRTPSVDHLAPLTAALGPQGNSHSPLW